jgi:hypothetical protein
MNRELLWYLYVGGPVLQTDFTLLIEQILKINESFLSFINSRMKEIVNSNDSRQTGKRGTCGTNVVFLRFGIQP